MWEKKGDNGRREGDTQVWGIVEKSFKGCSQVLYGNKNNMNVSKHSNDLTLLILLLISDNPLKYSGA